MVRLARRCLTLSLSPSTFLVAILLLGSLGSAAFAAALLRPWAFEVDVGGILDGPFVEGFHAAEANRETSFRWSRPRAVLAISGAGAPSSFAMRVHGGAAGKQAHIRNGDVTSSVNLRPGWQRLMLLPRAEGWSGDVVIELTTSEQEQGPDPRELGVALDWFSAHGRGTAVPQQLLSSFVIIALVTGLVGYVSRRPLIGLLAGGLFAFVAVPVLLLGSNTSYLFLGGYTARLSLVLVLGAALLWASERGLTALAARGALPASRCTQRQLAVVVLLGFLLRYGAMVYPLTFVSDLRFHLSRAWMIRQGKFLSLFLPNPQLTPTQWNTDLTIPYSPLYYVLTAPATFLPGPGPELAMMAFSSMLDGIAALLVGMLVVKAGWSERAAVLAALLAAIAPFGLLLSVSWGLFPTLLGQCLSLLVVFLWLGLGHTRSSWRAVLVTAGVQAFAYISYPTALLFLGTTWCLFVGLLAVRRHPLAAPVLRSGLIGAALALVLYYGWHLPALVGQTVPAVLSGWSARPAGPSLSRATIVNALAQPLWINYGLPLLIVVAGGVASLIAGKFKHRRESAAEPLHLLALAWSLTYIPFALANIYVPLIEKHTLHLLPIIAMLGGLCLANLSRRAWGGLLTCLILALILWQALSLEYERIVYAYSQLR